MNVAILHGWWLEGMVRIMERRMGGAILGSAGRRSIACEKPESAAGCQAASVIVDDHRERARSYKGLRFRSRWRPTGGSRRYVRLALLAMDLQRYSEPSLSNRPRDATPCRSSPFAIQAPKSLAPD